MKILFVNVGGASLVQDKYLTNTKFWLFIKHWPDDVAYMGPVCSYCDAEYSIDTLVYPLPCFRSLRHFYIKLFSSPAFIVQFFKAVNKYDWKCDAVYLRDTHPLTILMWFIAIKKGKLPILHITSNPRLIAETSFYGLRRFVYIVYSRIREKIEAYMAKKSVVLLSCRHPVINSDKYPGVYNIRTNLVSRNDIVDDSYVRNKYQHLRTLTRILYVGRISREKGIEDLVDAWAGISMEFKDATLDIIGDGPEMVSVHQMCINRNINRIQFRGAEFDRKVLLDKIRKAHLMVVPSREDGLPKVIFEALASGTCIVATKVGEMTSILSSGDYGWAANASNACSLRETIVEAMTNVTKCCRMAVNGVTNASDVSMESEIERIHDIVSKAK